jgi:hypothetical protein
MDNHPIGRARHVTVGVAVRDTTASPRVVVGFSGSRQRTGSRLQQPMVGGGATLRQRMRQAGFALATTAENILQNNPAYQPVAGGFANTNCAAPRCLHTARTRGHTPLGLAENWRGNAQSPNCYPIPNHPDPNAMEHCPQCELNQTIL